MLEKRNCVSAGRVVRSASDGSSDIDELVDASVDMLSGAGIAGADWADGAAGMGREVVGGRDGR